ncbi:MAG: hypothetical protein QNJ98_17170 [Planctomycetota bacterium]|nr:hypothetical protein [Planctomycetota bacterium]
MRRRSLPYALPALLLLLGLAGPTQAKEPPAPLTSFEAGPLNRATLIVVGETTSVRTQRQQQIARVRIDEVLRGTPPTRPLTVLVRGPHPASELGKAESTGFPGVGSGRQAFFLSRRTEGVACDYRDAFEVEGNLGTVKIAALREEIRLADIEDPDRRAKETRAYLVAGLGAKSPWTRTHAARELVRFTRARRDLVDEALEGRLRDRLRMRLSRDERTYLAAVVKHLERTPRRRAPKPKDEPAVGGSTSAASDPWRAAWLKAGATRRAELAAALLERPRPEDVERAFWAFGESEAETRRLLVRGLAELRRAELLKRVRGLYAGEEEIDVRVEILRAVGLLGGDADVPWLAERAQNRRLERAALLALARIRTDAARAALTAARTRIEEAGGDDAGSRVRWIDYLLSEAFEASTLMR